MITWERETRGKRCVDAHEVPCVGANCMAWCWLSAKQSIGTCGKIYKNGRNTDEVSEASCDYLLTPEDKTDNEG